MGTFSFCAHTHTPSQSHERYTYLTRTRARTHCQHYRFPFPSSLFSLLQLACRDSRPARMYGQAGQSIHPCRQNAKRESEHCCRRVCSRLHLIFFSRSSCLNKRSHAVPCAAARQSLYTTTTVNTLCSVYVRMHVRVRAV
jgi:hypothetical protein